MPTTIATTTGIDVISKYELLVAASLNADSPYIRTKETLAALLQEGSLSTKEKGQITSTVLGNLSSTLATTSMNGAIQWAAQEKDLELRKLELSYKLDLLEGEKVLQDAQIKKMGYENIALQANTIRTFGTPVLNASGDVASLLNEGKMYQDTLLTTTQVTKAGIENGYIGDLMESQLHTSQANSYRGVVESLVNYGSWQYSISNTGITAASTYRQDVNTATKGSFRSLSDVQQVIAQEQAKGYAYNAWANAATGSASMIGTVVSSDGTLGDISEATTVSIDTLKYLRAVVVPSFT